MHVYYFCNYKKLILIPTFKKMMTFTWHLQSDLQFQKCNVRLRKKFILTNPEDRGMPPVGINILSHRCKQIFVTLNKAQRKGN